MFRLIKDNCVVQARSEGLKNDFLKRGYRLIEGKNENNGNKAEEIKKTSSRKAVKKNEGKTED